MAFFDPSKPRFRIVTAHKPLVPLFNKVKAKVPPRIEKWKDETQERQRP